MKKVIAIDGPSGAGKSTIAKLLAKELGFSYLDTGALYRAAALHLRRSGLDESATDPEIRASLKKADIGFKAGKVFLNKSDVSDRIRSPEAGHYASVFSARVPVREFLLDSQRSAAETNDLVAEGRDMTTVVFPEAFRKFYLDASVEERARRRTLELASKGFGIDREKVLLDIVERDMRDSSRDIAPLARSADSIMIDSSELSIEKVFKKILDIINGKAE